MVILPQPDQGRTGEYWWPVVLDAARSWTLLSGPIKDSPFERRGTAGGAFVPLSPSPRSLCVVPLDFRSL